MKKATKTQTDNVYAFRNHCMKKLIKKVVTQGKEVFKYKEYDKKSLGVDLKINTRKIKYKAVKNTQIYLMFEVMNGSNPGWFAEYKDGSYKSVAEDLYYHIEELGIVYVVDLIMVRAYIKNPLNEIRTTDKSMYGGGWSYLVSIDDMMKNNIITRIINL